MPDKVTMVKGISLGYDSNEIGAELIGRAFGFDIYVERDCNNIAVIVYDRKLTRRYRVYGQMESQTRVAMELDLSKEDGAWHVDLVEVDSCYKGNNLAIKIYKFIMKALDITLKAGSTQSAGGRYLWNKMSKDRKINVWAQKSPYSKVYDYPRAGNRELISKLFDLYDSKANIFASLD